MNPQWVAQVRGILRMELRKNLFSTRAMPVYLLAAVPLFGVAMASRASFKDPPALPRSSPDCSRSS
jgi:hypothetical protein